MTSNRKKISPGIHTSLILCGALVMSAASAAGDPLPRAQPADVGFSASALERIDRFFTDEIDRGRIPGVVIAVARNGKLAYYKALGFQDKEAGVPMKSDAIFQLASMTKVMAVVGALTLYEEGRLPLKSPMSVWFPQFKGQKVAVVSDDGQVSTEPEKNPIFIQDLMRHTSGLTYGGRGATPVHKLYPSSSSSAAIAMQGNEFVDKLSQAPLLYQPGTTWDYGFSIDLLGLVMEKIEGKPLEQVLRERVWSKLDMADTTFHVPEAKRSRLAKPLPSDPITQKAQKIDLLDQAPKFDCGGGCAFGTASDYLRFGQMLLNGGVLSGGRILGPKTVQFMTSDQLGSGIKNNVANTEPGRVGYGFGLGVAVRTQPGVAAINGSVGDYSWNGANGTVFWVDPKEQLVVVMMAASPGEIRKTYRERLSAMVYGAMEDVSKENSSSEK